MISAKLDVAIVETIRQHAAAYRQCVIDLEETLFALCRVSSAQLANITDPDERAAMLCVLVDELQRAAHGQSSERGPGRQRAEDVRHSHSMADTAEGGRAVAGRLALKRIRLSRAKGWRMPENTVKVDRSTTWGNLFTVVSVGTREECVEVFSDLIKRGPCLGYLADAWPSVKAQEERRAYILANLYQLRGKNLACWCPLDQPCHADVLLQLANAPGEAGDAET